MMSSPPSENADIYVFLHRFQEEKYAHIEKADMEKVSKCLEEKSAWFNSNMNLCSQLKLHQNPPVTVLQIRAQKSVSVVILLMFDAVIVSGYIWIKP